MTDAQRMQHWIAKTVMGWRLEYTNDNRRCEAWSGNRRHVLYSPYKADDVFLWSPTTSKSDAIDAMEAWRNEDCLMRGWITGQQSEDEGGEFFAKLYGVREVRDETLPLAICKALCAATGMPGGENDAT